MCVGQQRQLKNKLWAPKGLILAKKKPQKVFAVLILLHPSIYRNYGYEKAFGA